MSRPPCDGHKNLEMDELGQTLEDVCPVRAFDGNARFLTDRAEHERAMAAIRQKYWMFRPFIALGRALSRIASCPLLVRNGLNTPRWECC